jgi:hypothetical protein
LTTRRCSVGRRTGDLFGGLHNIALQIQSDNDAARAAAIGSLIGLEIGALIVLLLSGKSAA